MVRLSFLLLVVFAVALVLRAVSRVSAVDRGPGRGRMTRAEALEVLGVEEGASKQEILNRYRSLMKKVHPDHPEGSTYLAAKLNQAFEVLDD